MSSDLDLLVDRIYSKLIDLAKEKNLQIKLNKEYDLVPANSNIEFSSIDTLLANPENKFSILKHTCLQCCKSFEQSKFLLRHFIIEHIVNNQVYKCDICNSQFALDDFLTHQFSDHLNRIELEPLEIYKLIVLKKTQDSIVDFYLKGKFAINKKNLKHLNKLKYGKETQSLNERINFRIYENYLFRQNSKQNCKPQIILSSKSLKSNLIYTLLSKRELLNDIFAYFSKKHDLNIPIESDIKYYQCKFCLKLENDVNDFKSHLINVHTFNEKMTNCIVCPYCHQLIKTNFNNTTIKMLNKHILEECNQVKMGTMYCMNNFKLNKTDCINQSSVETSETNSEIGILEESQDSQN